MRDQIGIILVENEAGELSVNLYAKVERAKEAFAEMKGSPADPRVRATILELDYNGGQMGVRAKYLPVLALNDSDGWVIGEGPVKFESENKPENFAE